jgi:lysophospholipase L1-like esterase
MNRTPLLPALAATLTLLAATASAAEPPPKTPAPALKIVLVGDSTVTDASGWGAAFAKRLGPGAVCLSHAKSGRSSRSYRDEGHWAKAIAEKPDYVLIQFGHNDQPGKGPERETDPATSYREFLGRYVAEARDAGALPVLVTPMTRRSFRGDKVSDTLGPYAEAVRAVAAEKRVPVLDLHARSLAAVEAMGPKAADRLGPLTKDGKPDRTHLSPEGAPVMAALVADELRKAVPALSPYLRYVDTAGRKE